MTKGERLEAAKLFYYSPSGNPPYGVLPEGCLLVRFISLHIKPALKGEVGFAKQKPEGLKKERGFACYRQPLSQTFGLPAPRKGEPYGERISPRTSARRVTQNLSSHLASHKKRRQLACL